MKKGSIQLPVTYFHFYDQSCSSTHRALFLDATQQTAFIYAVYEKNANSFFYMLVLLSCGKVCHFLRSVVV